MEENSPNYRQYAEAHPESDLEPRCRRAKFRFTLRGLLVGVLGLGVLLGLLKWLADAVVAARRVAIASAAQGPLNQLQLALLNYHDHHGHFPPAYLTDADGKPMHSWRVLLLPYVEQQSLYNAYRFDEPWNGPNNSRLANKMPRVFHSASEPESSTHTNIVAIVGPGTAFPGSSSTRLADFVDGQENTILLTEITNSDIQWLEPRDLNIDAMSFSVNDPDRPGISSARWRQPYVVFADRIKAYQVAEDMAPDALRALTTIDGGEPVTRSQLENQGHLR